MFCFDRIKNQNYETRNAQADLHANNCISLH